MSRTEIEKQHSDLLDLHLRFFAHLDLGWLEQDLRRRTFAPSQPTFSSRNQLIGTGSFCHAFRVPVSQANKSFDYALSIPHSLNTPATVHIQHCRTWMKGLKALEIDSKKNVAKKEPIPLVPPFMLINPQGPPALLSVYGAKSSDHAARHWHPIDESVERFQHHLMSLGMRVDDDLQMRSINGVPFIHDFSDLTIIIRK